MIVGKWLHVRETGVTEGIPYNNVIDEPFYLILGSDGSWKEIASDGNVEDAGRYQVDEQKSLVSIIYQYESAQWQDVYKITDLTHEKLILGWESEDGTDYYEFKRIPDDGRIASLKVISTVRLSSKVVRPKTGNWVKGQRGLHNKK